VYQYLVYDLPVKGPLSAFLRDGGKKAALTADARLSIMYGLVNAIHILHHDDGTGSSSFHRDIQSANIYLTENFTAQLMDSGLARFVPTDTNTSSTMLVMNDSPRTHVYMDPKFLENANSSLRYSYEAAYDVYSVGVVMMEIIVGCLFTENSDVLRRCVEEMDGNFVPTRLDELKKSADTINWNQKTLDLVCDAAICCTKPTTDGRITAKNLLLTLRAGMLDASSKGRNLDKYNCEERPCSVCYNYNSSRTCNKGHEVCPNCIESTILRGLPFQSRQACPMEDCRSSGDYLYGYISWDVFDLYLANQDPHNNI
jgi:serine/threonine protein kinase